MIGPLLNIVIDRISRQPAEQPETATWPNLHVVFTGGDYVIRQAGTYAHARTHKPLSNQRYGTKKDITRDTFEQLCEDAELAGDFRDGELAEAARVWAAANRPSGQHLVVLNRTLLKILAANHGAGGIDLLRSDTYIVAPPRS